jgi:hypothetical protein
MANIFFPSDVNPVSFFVAFVVHLHIPFVVGPCVFTQRTTKYF